MEQERFEIEILPLRPRLMQLAKRLLPENGMQEDVVQETMIKLWLMRNQLDKYRSIEALAIVITRHLCYDFLRKDIYNRVDLSAAENINTASTPEDELLQQEETNRLLKIISLLPDMQQSILQMKHIDGLEVAEIARITGGSPDSIRMNLSRARKRIKELFIK